ncbi:hypothetical protein J4406_02245 [Candidatus Woesearchaeota archaeon]|nr:hypothetical protein [Candidatus Woesearchaeota archaeon]
MSEEDNIYEYQDKFQINPELQKKFEQIKNKIDKFKKEAVKKHKEIIGIALLPNVSPLRFSSYMDAGVKKDEKLEEENKDKINLLVLVDDQNKKEMFELKHNITKSAQEIAKGVDENFLVKVKLIFEIKEDCFDGRYEFLQLISLGAIFYDPNEFLAGIKVSEIHKNMVIKKFDKYIFSYIAAGSLFRGDKKSNDIDVYIIVDDTDVKRMSRYELKERLRGIILSYGAEASRIAGVKKQFHVQTYILTDFWEAVKDAHPVMFTFIRDGVPLYDRGMFMPWRLLLKMGRIRPSPEAIDMQMDVGEKMLERTRFKLLSVVGEDLYYAILNPAQAALMLYGVNPPTPKETISLMRDIFVKKEKLFMEKHVKLLEDVRGFYKNIEHGKLKEVSGKQIDDFLNRSKEYLKAIKGLFDTLQKQKDRENVDNLYESCNALIKDLLNVYKVDGEIEQEFRKLVNRNEVPKKYMEIYKKVKETKSKRLSKAENDKTAREARIFLKSIAEFIQRKREYELERVRVRVKYGNKYGDVYIFGNDVFVIEDIDAKEKTVSKANIKDGRLKDISKSSIEDFEKFTKNVKIHSRVFIKEKLVEDLKGIFGKDIEIMIGY